jgi:oxygen-independent coproporphyrinogen-3 oxidase
MELMSNFKLDIARFEKLYNVVFATYFADALEALKPFEDDGLLSITPTSIECSPTGTLLIRNICIPFDAYMKRHVANQKTFSKTV